MLVHDEATYLLQADTFARGRFTNPSPPHPEFFESPYLLFNPTYQGKYPPAQALFLAIGERVFGRPIWGVWLSCGLFAAALFWMLAGWTNRMWALLGTEFAVVGLGITHPWATTYWGAWSRPRGGPFCSGRPDTHFYGGHFAADREFRGLDGCVQWRASDSWPVWGWWCSSTRGLMRGVSSACRRLVLGCWLLRGAGRGRLEKMAAWGGPCILVIAVGGAGMAFYNHVVTGSWKTLPYGRRIPAST